MADEERTVLVVDDEDALRTLTARMLQKRGYKVVTARQGGEALAILASGLPIRLVVLDVLMPGMSGLETLEQIRRRWSYTQLPVILLTAQSSNDQLVDGYRTGADYYLTKPLRAAALLHIVDYLIGDLAQNARERLEALL